MGFVDLVRSRYEVYRLEKRYARREKRTTFASGAQYVDGEYIYSPTNTSPNGSLSSSTSPNKGGMGLVNVKEVYSNKRASRAF